MPKISAGLLLYRRRDTDLEVFLVHPGGPFWAKKDAAAWSIPKGEIDADEPLLAAAQREFVEETGILLARDDADSIILAPVKHKGGKVVHAFALEVGEEVSADAIRSNTFSMEWPPRSGRQQEFPEVDRAAWFSLTLAAEKIHVGQRPLLDDLQRHVGT
jgi:predicted NUDIX family NTP pyrophosphohydrolase